MSIERYENYGIVKQVGQPVLTFEIQSQVTSDETLEMSALPTSSNGTTRIGDYAVAVYGHHNNLPMELMLSVKANRLLPEILEKQRRYLYGKGPYMYIEQTEDGNVKRMAAKQQYPDIVRRVTRWLESWESVGAKDDYKAYLRKQINEFYYCENLFTLFSFNKSRLIFGDEPVRYLESIPNIHGRLASSKDLTLKDTVSIADFDGVLVGDWLRYNHRDKLLYPLFDRRNKFANGIAVAMDRNDSFGETIYGYPAWYYGLKEWIRGSNLNPKYINSFLKNSLGAKLHVLIPQSWCDSKQRQIENVCKMNAERAIEGKPLIKYLGVLDVGVEYRDQFVEEMINIHLRKVTELLSGEGKNQGKIWATRKFQSQHGVEEWEFKEIPTKVKDYIETLIKFDERTDHVILEGKGMDPSLSGVSKEGVISKSGSDLYYNYLLYLDNLQIAEEIVLKHINEAIALNFPEVEAAEIKLGFLHNVIQRQQDVSPQNRINQTVQP